MESQGNVESIEQNQRDLDERYLIGVQNIALASQQAKVSQIQSWGSTDKLVNDFFTFSLITLGVMATVLTAGQSFIGNIYVFYAALGLQAFVVIFSSIVRLYIDSHSSGSSDKVLKEFTNRIQKIDLYRLAMTDTNVDEKSRVRAQMESAFAPEYEYELKSNSWILKNGQKAIVTVFIVGFLLFVLSLILNITINK